MFCTFHTIHASMHERHTMSLEKDSVIKTSSYLMGMSMLSLLILYVVALIVAIPIALLTNTPFW